MAIRSLTASAAVVGLLVLCSAPAQAQGPPINTQNAFVNGLNGSAFRTFFLGFDRSDLRVDGERMRDPLDRTVHVRGQMFVLPYELLPNRLVIMGAIPYLDKTLEMNAPVTRQELSANGLGDFAIAAKVNIFSARPAGPDHAGGAVRTPQAADGKRRRTRARR